MTKKNKENQTVNNIAGLRESSDGGVGGGSKNSPQDSSGSAKDLVVQQMLPPHLFVLPVDMSIVFPTMMAPINISHERFVATVEEVLKGQRMLGLVLISEKISEDHPEAEKPGWAKVSSSNLYHYGVAVKILKRLKMPDGSINILVHSMKRFRIKKVLAESPHIIVDPEYLEDKVASSNVLDALSRTIISDVKKLSEINPFFTEEMKLALLNAPGPGVISDLVAFSLSLPKATAQEFLETLDVKERFEKLLVHLRRERDVANIQKKIQGDVNEKIGNMQREYFLKEQLKVIKRELGLEEEGKTQSSRTLREKIEAKGMPADIKKIALQEVEKFETLSDNSPEYNLIRNYLETIVALPWSETTSDNLNLTHARQILERDHYGLEKIKDRIIEFLAVRRLISDAKPLVKKDSSSNRSPSIGSIICLVGPPGVGKTSIGKSIAETLGRQFYRFSLGGMRDEAEIKGHRRTYIGAMPGKIIQAMKRVGTKNPVIMLDEVDKLGSSFQGDPSSALLEVLDPEQNHQFLDHYLDLPFDLSQVFFIATANTISTIPEALIDRMEIIEIPGYTLEEKEKIATEYVIPKVLRSHSLKNNQLKIERGALRAMIKEYAREPGLRTLQQNLEKIARKTAAKVVFEKETSGKMPSKANRIQSKDLTKWLGPKRFYNELAERITTPGVVVGLAWTSAGGDILFIEATDAFGSGQLKLTGKMGDVMSESANIAWTYVKRKVGLKKDFLKGHEVHIHIPAGAIPKDGPSAGVTMATALYSLLTQKTSRQKVAMTGELSLTGKVLPVGGIKEKILAAKRAGITSVILPKLNQKDMIEVPPYALKGMKLHFVDNVDQVFKLVCDTKN